VALQDFRDLVRRHVGTLFAVLVATTACSGAAGAATAASPQPSTPAVAVASTSSDRISPVRISADRISAVCSAWVDSDMAAARALLNAQLGSGTPEQIQAIVKDFWSAQQPILASMQPAPEPIQADVDNLLALAGHGAATGDSATLVSPDLHTADHNIDQYMLRACGYPLLQITATDTAYQGVPATIRSGAVGITLDNHGREAHQVLIVRINDGVTEPFTALLDLPPEQRAQAATALGSVQVDPGQVDTVFLRLTPGRYGAADFLTQGTARLDTPGNGDPHYLHGLHAELTLT
jgi:hypothetical protein